MARLMLIAVLTAMLTLTCAQRAEARIFEPQHDWWHSGRTCIESRSPAGLEWDGAPPRACVAQETIAERKHPRGFFASKNEVWAIAFSGGEQVDEASTKPPKPRRLEVLAQPGPGVRHRAPH